MNGALPRAARIDANAMEVRDLCASRNAFVIPGRAAWRGPGIHTFGGGYGFRVRSFHSRPERRRL